MLRGINVSGQKKIKMIELRSLLEQEGFFNVTTYIQSGNIVMDSDLIYCDAVSQSVHRMIEREYGWDVSVITKEPSQMVEIINQNPFLLIFLLLHFFQKQIF